MRKLADSVVVITGASSGIGRATAYAFAREHAGLVLGARRGEHLQQVARKCEEFGASACVAVPCDVSRLKDVVALAEQAMDRFGGFDVWVNNAAVTAFGRSDNMPYDVYRQVIETNLLGCIHGSRAAIAQFRRQGRGVLINVASMAGKIAHPYMSAYSASKYGVVGLSNSLRAELRQEPDIHVCTVLPVATDTPLFQHGANYLGREAKPPPPVYSAERVARAIVDLARRPRREVTIGAMGKILWTLNQVAPGLAERAMAQFIERAHFKRKAFPPHEGNVLSPTEDPYAITGGWKREAAVGRSRGFEMLLGLGITAVGAWAVYSLAKSTTTPRRERETAVGKIHIPHPSEPYTLAEREEIAEIATMAGASLHLDRSR